MYLWTTVDSPRLTTRARRLIGNASRVYVSAVSIWEAAVKISLGKLSGDLRILSSSIEQMGFMELPVRVAHSAGAATLPLLHRDPFDRLLLCQAMEEPLRLLTADEHLQGYGEIVLVA